MKKDLSIIIVLAFIAVVGGVLFRNTPDEPLLNGLRLGESQTIGNVVVKPLSIVEDSRCPEDAECIWAGTVKVRTEIKSGLGTSSQVLELNRPITTEAEEVTLVSVSPSPRSGAKIREGDYRFVFTVKERAATNPNTPPVTSSGGCYVGGCSSQICSDRPDAVSTCEYRAEYACYRTAKCERQVSGMCGWTETPELKMCLKNATPNQEVETIY